MFSIELRLLNLGEGVMVITKFLYFEPDALVDFVMYKVVNTD